MGSIVTSKVYHNVEKMFIHLKTSESWRGKIETQEGFTKEDKEALNAVAFCFLKEIMLDEEEDVSAIVPYILRRLYIKKCTWDAKPRNKKFFRENIKNFDEQVVNYVLDTVPKGETTVDGKCDVANFINYIDKEAEKLPEEVKRVYDAAKALTTLIEYEELKDQLRPDTRQETSITLRSELERHIGLPHFSEIVYGIGKYGKLKDLLTSISWSRYTVRWQGYIWHVRCSILAHMLEAAILGYMMNLEMGRKSDIINDFWILLFHDMPEIWTDDVPGPTKNELVFTGLSDLLKEKLGSATAKLRKIAEFQETDALEKNFYTQLPEELCNFFRNGVMLEDVKDPEIKKFYKGADYFSADLEVWWNIRAGSRDEQLPAIFRRSLADEYRTPEQKKVLKEFLKKCDDVTFI